MIRRGLVRAPPPETMFLHRKLVGSFLLLARIGAKVDARSLVLELPAESGKRLALAGVAAPFLQHAALADRLFAIVLILRGLARLQFLGCEEAGSLFGLVELVVLVVGTGLAAQGL